MYSMIEALGWCVLLYFGSRLAQVIYSIIYPYYIAKPLKLKEAAGGKWAVVTGSTDGIGRAYALELARNGFSIVLISRTQSKLDHVKAEIESATNAEVCFCVFACCSSSMGLHSKNAQKLITVAYCPSNTFVPAILPIIF
ncbi:unnamed protein product [Gongylonema pulchrum]|uniref:Hydroxysteroid 17-beta dehydrogenase 12 n=1 Tax=Gongylonema pulchrum TaxID=637853 RepID=A0A183D5E9_9BILA|nr:unnamed protein product [Gongylonema pulchrum]